MHSSCARVVKGKSLMMKLYIPSNWGWYVATLILFGPLLTTNLINPSWVGRLIGLSFMFLMPSIVCIWTLFSKENFIIEKGSLVSKKLSPEYSNLISRIVIFSATVASIFFGVPSFSERRYLCIGWKRATVTFRNSCAYVWCGPRTNYRRGSIRYLSSCNSREYSQCVVFCTSSYCRWGNV